jgi:hypothetical protein
MQIINDLRSTGNLTFTGYSCEVFGVRNICSLSKIEPRNRPAHKYTVKVLSEQPLLEVETSMPKTPIVGEAIPNNGGIAEALVFSGQRVEKIITLYNSNTKLSIRRVVIKINQLEVSLYHHWPL